MKKAKMLCLGPKKSLFSPRLELNFFLKKMPIPGNFFFFSKTVDYNFFAEVWKRTVDFRCQKRPLYQLCHNDCPRKLVVVYIFDEK